METKANTTLIGLFTLAVLAGLVGFITWFSRGGQERTRTEYVVLFDGAVGGLLTGGSVLFNGIKVGDVKTLALNPTNPKQVLATVSVDSSAPIRKDTRVTLDYQGLTGITAISMRGGDSNAGPVEGTPPILYAEPSAVQDLMASARQVMARTESIMERLDKFVSENDKTLSQAAKNIETFTEALSKNSDNIDHFLAEMGGASQHISLLADRLSLLTEHINKLIAGVDAKQFPAIVRNVETITGNLAKDSGQVSETLADLRRAIRAFETAMGPIGDVAKSLDNQKIASILANVDKFSTALGDNSANVDKIVKDAADVSAKLNSMADRIDKLISDFSGGPNGSTTVIADFSEAAKAVKLLAEKLDKRTSELTSSFSGFSDKTSRELQGIAADGRRTLQELDRTLKAFEKNPQRIIFGGSGVPEYSGRR